MDKEYCPDKKQIEKIIRMNYFRPKEYKYG